MLPSTIRQYLIPLGLSFILVLSVASTALGNHWHTAGSCGIEHGLLHGSSSGDGAFFARAMGNTCGSNKSCLSWRYRGLQTSGQVNTYTASATCSAFFSTQGVWEYYCGQAAISASTPSGNTVISPHVHNSHHFDSSNCPQEQQS